MRWIAAILVMGMAVMAQTPAGHKIAFDVVSVKQNKSGAPLTFHNGPGMFSVNGETVRQLLTGAYQVQDFQIFGGPSWIASDRFDIEGKFQPSPSAKTAVDLMIRSLLADRFQLHIHREARSLRAYELSIAPKGNGKLKQAEEQQSVGGAPANKDIPGAAPPPGSARFGVGSVIAPTMPIETFVRFLSTTLRAPVIDKTGLVGKFNVELRWRPDIGERNPFGESSPDTLPEGPSLFTALDEQLGLKLESVKGPVEVLVIDSVEHPTEN